MTQKNWIQKTAISEPGHKGKLRKALGIDEGETIPMKKLEKAEHSKSPSLRKEAVLAETLRNFKKKGK